MRCPGVGVGVGVGVAELTQLRAASTNIGYNDIHAHHTFCSILLVVGRITMLLLLSTLERRTPCMSTVCLSVCLSVCLLIVI